MFKVTKLEKQQVSIPITIEGVSRLQADDAHEITNNRWLGRLLRLLIEVNTFAPSMDLNN